MEKPELIKKEIREIKYVLYALIILLFIIGLLLMSSLSFYYNMMDDIRCKIYNNVAVLSMSYSSMKSYLILKFGFDIPKPILDFITEYEIRTNNINSKLDFMLNLNFLLKKSLSYSLLLVIISIFALAYISYKVRKLEKII